MLLLAYSISQTSPIFLSIRMTLANHGWPVTAWMWKRVDNTSPWLCYAALWHSISSSLKRLASSVLEEALEKHLEEPSVCSVGSWELAGCWELAGNQIGEKAGTHCYTETKIHSRILMDTLGFPLTENPNRNVSPSEMVHYKLLIAI